MIFWSQRLNAYSFIMFCLQVSTAVEVLLHLGTFEKELNLIVEQALKDIENGAKKALDIQVLTQTPGDEKSAKQRGICQSRCIFSLRFSHKIFSS